MPWSFDDGKPIYVQICDRLRADIVCGKYQKGERIPSVRELSLDASVNPNTMQRALMDLEREGLIVTQGTNGKYVCDDIALLGISREKLLQELTAEFLNKTSRFGATPQELCDLITQKGEKEEHGE